MASRASPDVKYLPLEIWLGVIAPSAGLLSSTPATATDAKSMPRGPLAPPPCAPGTPLCCGVCVCAGTVPEMVVMLSVSPPDADATPDSFEIEVTFVAGKLIWVLRKDVRVNFAPAFRL